MSSWRWLPWFYSLGDYGVKTMLLSQHQHQESNVGSRFTGRSRPGDDLLSPVAAQSCSSRLICKATTHSDVDALSEPGHLLSRFWKGVPLLSHHWHLYRYLLPWYLVCAASTATFKYASEFIEPIFYRDTDLLLFEIRTVNSVTVSTAAFSIDLSIL